MADWKGRGKGRLPGGTSTNTFAGGAGMGSGRAGSQPTLGANTSVELPGRTYSLSASTTIPTSTRTWAIKESTAIATSARSWSLKAAVSYGGSSSKSYTFKGSAPTTEARGGSTFSATQASSGTGEASAAVADPEGNFIFQLLVGGTEIAQFRECSGLKSSTTVFELEEGGMNHAVHKLPGQSRWDNIVLRSAVTSSSYLMEWRDEVLQDSFAERRNVSIVMMTLQRTPVRYYNVTQAWPVSWEGPAFDAQGTELAVESIELAHHGISVT